MKLSKLQKRIIIIGSGLTVLILSLIIIYKLFLDPYRGTAAIAMSSGDLNIIMTREEASEDLTFIKNILKERHAACVKGLPAEVQAQYEKEVSELPDKVTVLNLWQASARILSKLKDAHTSVSYENSIMLKLPLQFEMSDGKLICISEGYDNAVVESIGGIKTDELYKTFLTQFSYELESYASYIFAKCLSYEEYLEFVGVDTNSDITIVFQSDKGIREENAAFKLPVQDADYTEQPFVSYKINKDNNLGILVLTSCDNNDYYKNTVKEFFTKVKADGIDNVAVDLRHNGGGNSSVINEFLRYINVNKYYTTGDMAVRYGNILYKHKKQAQNNRKNKDLLFNGRLYALTSTNTFSSAEMFALTIKDNNLGTVIGEIPGNMPASYGDVLFFQTPNAKLSLTVSYKHFGRIDKTKSELPLIPDIEVKADEAEAKLYDIINK